MFPVMERFTNRIMRLAAKSDYKPMKQRALARALNIADEDYNSFKAALEELRRVWPELRAQWGDGALAESREQYLRRALQIWQSRVSRDGVRDPMAVAQALDVVSLLFGDV